MWGLSRDRSDVPDTVFRLLGEIPEIVCITRQRIYAKVDPGFRNVLEDSYKFAADLPGPTHDHDRCFERFLSANGVVGEYMLESWREKRSTRPVRMVCSGGKEPSNGRASRQLASTRAHPCVVKLLERYTLGQ